MIIRDLVYAFQGIEGRWIRFDPTKEGYRINHQVTLMQYKILYHQNKLFKLLIDFITMVHDG